MKFFCNAGFIRKILIIVFLSIIIILLIIGRFRTMRVKIVGKEEWGHISFQGMTYDIQRNVPELYPHAQ